MRAALVSVNLFSLLCDGNASLTTSSIGTIMRFGGPILYLFFYSFTLLGILIWVDSGSLLPPQFWTSWSALSSGPGQLFRPDVVAETHSASVSHDLLRVLDVTKSFGGNIVVEHMSLGVSRDTVFALLGPNGAGKITMFNLIRELLSFMRSSDTQFNSINRW